MKVYIDRAGHEIEYNEKTVYSVYCKKCDCYYSVKPNANMPYRLNPFKGVGEI